ncbi:hypothetical protein V2J09_000183 [Rumex salicifolius]
MGKQGPCYHCGVTSTPLWRNGPSEKPVLCNACGSRWRTKGTLANYTPLHSRIDADEYEDRRLSRLKTVSLKIGEEKLKKRKLSYENSVGKRFASDYNQTFLESIDEEEDTCNRSSYGSALSNSELQFSGADACDFTGPAQSTVWETQVPSKKRSLVNRTNSSPVEKLIKDLHAILHEQQQSSYLSGSSEEDLLFESDVPNPMVSVEIGHGSVLIKHPSSFACEEDSEASSLSFENKPCAVNEGYSYYESENVTKFRCEMMQQKPAKRDQFNNDRMQHLLTHKSPLCYIDLYDVINFKEFMGDLTSEEQQQLLKYLPSDDTLSLPGSLEHMFDSSSFKDNLVYFQQLLSDGGFSNNSEAKVEVRKLALSNLIKSKWLELYIKLKDSKSPNQTLETEVESGSELSSSKDLQSAKRPLQEQNLNIPDKETNESPKRGLNKSGFRCKEPIQKYGSFFTPGRLFNLPTDNCHIRLESCHDEFSDQDLLLDVPSNCCFPEAELLLPPSMITSHQTSVSSSSIHSAMIHH